MISIVLPVRTIQKNINDCLKSCINQTYKNIEILIFDIGSDNKTEQEIRKIHDENLGGLIRYFWLKTRKDANIVKEAYNMMRGNWFKMISPGTILEQNHLSYMMDCVSITPEHDQKIFFNKIQDFSTNSLIPKQIMTENYSFQDNVGPELCLTHWVNRINPFMVHVPTIPKLHAKEKSLITSKNE